MGYVLGIDLGGTCIKSVAVTAEGARLRQVNRTFDAERPRDWAEGIRRIVQETAAELEQPAEAIGLSAPGLANPEATAIRFMPGRLEGLEGLEWTRFLGAPRPVPVLNDAHAALWGEHWLGAARGFRNVILLTLGTGVGGAALVDGRLLRGHLGRAGHLGHMSLDPDGAPDIAGTPGSLELAIGNGSILDRTGGQFRSTHELIAAHAAGDAAATLVWLKSVKALAAAVSSFINLFDPEAVIIGGGIAQAGPHLFEPLETFLDSMEWRPGGHRVRLLPAELGEYAGAFGAARRALAGAGP